MTRWRDHLGVYHGEETTVTTPSDQTEALRSFWNGDEPRRVIVLLPPIGPDGRCTRCGKVPSRDTGSCGCHRQVIEQVNALAATPPPSVGPLPPVTPIPGLDVRRANDLLSPESKAALDANLRDIARTQRQALAAAATMPLAGATPPPSVEALDVGTLAAAWLNVWGGSAESPPTDPVVLALRDLMSAIAAEYAALHESPENDS